MKKTLITCIISVLLTMNSSGQLWYLTRGLSTDEVAWGADVDSTGNIYWAVGEKSQWPFWYFDIFLFKIDSNGQQIWQTTPWGNGTGYNDIAFVAKVSGDKVYLAGRADSTWLPVSGDALVLCYNTGNGNLNWSYIFNPVPDNGYEEIDGLIVQPDGIYLTGWTVEQSTGYDFLIHKTDLSGQQIWSASWDYSGGLDGANGHCALDNNFIYAAGHTNLLNGSLVCFSRTNGAYQWDVTWSGSNNDEVLGLTMSADSVLYTVGYYSPPGNSQTCIKKFSKTGQLMWTRNWGGTGNEDSRAIITGGDSIIFVVGTTSSYGNGGKDIFVLKYDTAGILIDSLLWGGIKNETAQDVTMYGEYLYITGETSSYGNAQINNDTISDGLLLKINGRTMQAPDSSMTFSSNAIQYAQNSVQVFPNPFVQNTTVNVVANKDQPITKYDIRIINIIGDIVFEQTPSSLPETLNLNLPCGIYIMRVSGDNFIQTIKLEVIK